jgi:WD40 repeat protein
MSNALGLAYFQPTDVINTSNVGNVETLAYWIIRGNTDALTVLAISPDERTLISGSGDGKIRFHQIGNGTVVSEESIPTPNRINTLNYVNNGKDLLIGAKGGKLYKRETDGDYIFLLKASADPIQTTVSQDEKTIVILTEGKGDYGESYSVEFFSLDDGSLIKKLSGTGFAYLPNQEEFLLGTTNGKVQLWSAVDLKYKKEIDDKNEYDTQVIVDPSGRMMADISLYMKDDGDVRLINLDDYSQISTLNGAWKIQSLAFSPDGTLVATSSYSNNDAWLWSTADGSNIIQFQCNTLPITDILFHPDGKKFFTSSSDGTICVWGIPKEKSNPPLPISPAS